MNKLAQYGGSEGGSSTAEFALVLVPFMALVLGLIAMCTVLYFNATLQHAVEDSARWASIETVVGNGAPPSSTAVQAHFNKRYVGPTVDQFTYNSAAAESTCSTGAGTQTFHRVYAHAIFQFDAVLVSVPVGMQASACFP